jgi:UDP-N-acetylmuramate--alanine ligase
MTDQLATAKRVHLVGVGGSGMSSLGQLLLLMGKQVSGSDLSSSAATRSLAEAGAEIHVGHAAENVDGATLVIRSAAVPTDNPELAEARRRGIPSLTHAEALGELTRGHPTAAVAGTHGKTTTTGLIAWLLDRAGLEPTALIGGVALNFPTGIRLGEGPFVVEADEYDRRFLQLTPEVAVVTNVEADHLDYYRDLDEIEATFQAFVDRLPRHGRLVVCLDDPRAAALRTDAQRETYGASALADWRVRDYAPLSDGGSRFVIHAGGRAWKARSRLIGWHNALNATAALVVADHFGVGLRAALSALAEFKGTRRRFETRGRPGGIWVVDDYAHHPSELATVLHAARERVPQPAAIWAVFQPHSLKRTAALFDDFLLAFDEADHVLVLPVYRPAGREQDDGATVPLAQRLVDAIRTHGHPDVRLVESFAAAESAIVEGVRAGDLVLTMGAGDVTLLADRFVASLDGSERS